MDFRPFGQQKIEAGANGHMISQIKHYIRGETQKQIYRTKIWDSRNYNLPPKQMGRHETWRRGRKTEDGSRSKWHEANMGVPRKTSKPTKDTQRCTEKERYGRTPWNVRKCAVGEDGRRNASERKKEQKPKLEHIHDLEWGRATQE